MDYGINKNVFNKHRNSIFFLQWEAQQHASARYPYPQPMYKHVAYKGADFVSFLDRLAVC